MLNHIYNVVCEFEHLRAKEFIVQSEKELNDKELKELVLKEADSYCDKVVRVFDTTPENNLDVAEEECNFYWLHREL